MSPAEPCAAAMLAAGAALIESDAARSEVAVPAPSVTLFPANQALNGPRNTRARTTTRAASASEAVRERQTERGISRFITCLPVHRALECDRARDRAPRGGDRSLRAPFDTRAPRCAGFSRPPPRP